MADAIPASLWAFYAKENELRKGKGGPPVSSEYPSCSPFFPQTLVVSESKW